MTKNYFKMKTLIFSIGFAFLSVNVDVVVADCRQFFSARQEWVAQNVESGEDLRKVLQHGKIISAFFCVPKMVISIILKSP